MQDPESPKSDTRPGTLGRLGSVLSASQQKALTREMGTKTWQDGERIQSPHEPARGLYLIRSGVVRFTNVRDDGRALESFRMASGEWFGHVSLLSGLPPAHEAFAVGSTRLGVLPRERFNYLLEQDPELCRALLRLLAANMHQLFLVLDDLRSLSARSIVVKWLLFLSDRGATPHRLEVDHETLAVQLGLTRVTVGKVLRELTKANAIRQGYGWVEILDRNALGHE